MRRRMVRANISRCWVVLLACAAWGTTAVAAPAPSRAPEPGCTWRPFEGLGVRLLVQDCASEPMHYIFSVNGDWIEQHRPSDDTTFVSHQVIRVLHKAADMPIDETIMQFAGPTLPPEARGHCVVTKVRVLINDDQKILLTLRPTGAYARKIDAELRDGPRDFGCGEYGAGQQNTYFEYHPKESRTRFLFVVAGWDEPLFDEQNIQISDLPQ